LAAGFFATFRRTFLRLVDVFFDDVFFVDAMGSLRVGLNGVEYI
jgi:hypothetical protein